MKGAVTVLIAMGLLAAMTTSPVRASGLYPISANSAGRAGDPYGSPGKSLAVTRTVRIVALDTLRFTPSRIHVRPGQTIRFRIHNGGHLTHEFVIGDPAAQLVHEAQMEAHPGMGMANDSNGVSIPPGQTRTLIWQFPEHTGTVEYACHEPGHFAAGMVGHIDIVSGIPRRGQDKQR